MTKIHLLGFALSEECVIERGKVKPLDYIVIDEGIIKAYSKNKLQDTESIDRIKNNPNYMEIQNRHPFDPEIYGVYEDYDLNLFTASKDDPFDEEFRTYFESGGLNYRMTG